LDFRFESLRLHVAQEDRRASSSPEQPRGENVGDLMEALRQSFGGTGAETKAPNKSTEKPKKAAAGQKEMPMPIAGKKQAKEGAAKKPAARSQRKSA
jgi:DNA end-binding protein Ku